MSHGIIKSLWRYPVKSILGEKTSRLEIDDRGVVYDRVYAILDQYGKLGSGKDTRRFKRMDGLLSLRGKVTETGVSIEFPDGAILNDGDAALNGRLCDFLGQSARLGREENVSHFDDGSIHLITTHSLSKLQSLLPQYAIDERRFRPNIMIETASNITDDDLLGHVIEVGEVKLEITHKTGRCRMISLPQDELRGHPTMLKEMAACFGLSVGVYAKVISPGVVSCGERFSLKEMEFISDDKPPML